MAQSALNGYFERVRKLFRLVGVSDVPEGVMPVVIAGDSREPSSTDSSYREFAITPPEVAGPLGAGAIYKFKALADVVITRVSTIYGAGSTSVGGIGVASVADVVADAAATYNVPSTLQGAWAHRPEAGPPPMVYASNGASPIGRRLISTARNAAILYDARVHLFVPEGAAVVVVGPTAATNWVVNVEGYSAR